MRGCILHTCVRSALQTPDRLYSTTAYVKQGDEAYSSECGEYKYGCDNWISNQSELSSVSSRTNTRKMKLFIFAVLCVALAVAVRIFDSNVIEYN